MTTRREIESAPTLAGEPEGQPLSHPTGSAAAGPTLLADRYEVLGLLGIGGMGRVYRVRDRVLDEIVALKVLRRELVDSPGLLERFRQEVKLARRVTSPHVVRTFDLGEHQGEAFLTMEYVEGESLASVLERGALAASEARRIAIDVCAGVAAAHAAGILHRDLKPDNVLVAANGRIVLTDFGIARATSTAKITVDRLVGTPAYMAPEQVQGAETLTPAVDVYALGAVLFEMLTARRAWPGDDPIAVAVARLSRRAPDPRAHRDVPASLAEIVLRCMERDPASRFADASELRRALADASFERPTEVPKSSTVRPDVPAKAARSVALLPLRAPADLVDLAEGLSEEIVDALSLTRGLRVRPLASIRSAGTEGDPRAIGSALGVDVVVDGSIRRLGEKLRVSARAIGIADGFQLWASRLEAPLEGLLSLGDDVARAIAGALTVEIDAPDRFAVADPRATALYLEGKHRLRAHWNSTDIARAIPALESAHALAPEDPNVLAAYSMALARAAFFSVDNRLSLARELAESAVARQPASGEPWLALGIACLYAASIADAGFALSRAVSRAPGLASAHTMLGAMLLEAADVDAALTHLDAAIALDPPAPQATWDAARAHAYGGRFDVAERMLAELPESTPTWRFNKATTLARFRMWQGERHRIDSSAFVGLPESFRYFAGVIANVHATGAIDPSQLATLHAIHDVPNPRMRATRGQFISEVLVFGGMPEEAFPVVEEAVAAGLQDLLWIDRCPMLATFREQPRFAPLRETVAKRADEVLAAVRNGKRP